MNPKERFRKFMTPEVALAAGLLIGGVIVYLAKPDAKKLKVDLYDGVPFEALEYVMDEGKPMVMSIKDLGVFVIEHTPHIPGEYNHAHIDLTQLGASLRHP